MEEKRSKSKPFSEAEKDRLQPISEWIREAAQGNQPEVASYLRRQLIQAAERGWISSEELRDLGISPSIRKYKRQK